MTGADTLKDESVVYSEKVITENEKRLDEKHAEDSFEEPWISQPKGLDELENQPKKKFHLSDETELDIAIINDITVTEDDPSLKSVTFRSVLIGVILSCLSSSVQQLMIFKPVGIPLTDTFMLILAYVFCTTWARVLPKGGWLNPGPFNVKEHTCIYIMVSSANTSAYGTWILSAQELFYTDTPGAAGSIFLLFATQLVGYGIAGQLRPYLVYPSNMIWPTSLPTVSLLKTFNTERDEAKWRTRFFFIIFASIFVYEFIPQYMFPMIGGISIICLAKNDSAWVQRIFGGLGVNEGMGIFQFSFDWNLLSSLSPMTVPLWVQLNVYFGIMILWVVGPLLYYYDVWNAQSFPFMSNGIFQLHENGTVNVYPQEKVLNADNTLNQTLLEQVGQPQFSTLYAMNYVLINFGVTAAISHVFLFYGGSIWKNFRASRSKKDADGEDDIHVRLMKSYPEVPNWWYYTIFVLGIGLNVGVAYANKSQLPWWGVIFAIFLSTCLSLPLNLISAVTGQTFGLNVLTELICGLILPGLPIANMYFKTLGFNTMHQAGIMAKDLKIGHYLKVPPRMTFIHQIVGTVIGCIFNYIVNYSITHSKREVLLDPIGNQFWNGASPQTINSAAITWGAIGPIAMFGPDTQYYIFLWAFVIGLVLPVPGYLLHRKFPNAGFHLFNVPMVLMGVSLLPGTNSSWITGTFIVILVFQGYIKQRHSVWFARHNYLISAALDSGTSLMVFFVSMALYGGASGVSYEFPTWWGNRADARYMDQCCLNCE